MKEGAHGGTKLKDLRQGLLQKIRSGQSRVEGQGRGYGHPHTQKSSAILAGSPSKDDTHRHDCLGPRTLCAFRTTGLSKTPPHPGGTHRQS